MGNIGLPLKSESPKNLRDRNVVTRRPTREQNSFSISSFTSLPLLRWKKFGFIPNSQSARTKFLNEDILPFL